MPVEKILSQFLDRETDSDPDAAVLHECRHCGSKFDEPVTRCPICDATEIATYEFPASDDDSDDGSDGNGAGGRETDERETDAGDEPSDAGAANGNEGPAAGGSDSDGSR